MTAIPPPFSPAQWKALQARLVQRGFDRAIVQILGSSSMERPRFVLVGAVSSSSKACVFAARGVRLGPAVCPGRREVVAFMLGIDAHTEVVAAVGGPGIAEFAVKDRKGCGVSLKPFPIGNAVGFEGTFYDADAHDVQFLRGYDSAGRVRALAELPLASSAPTVRRIVGRAVSPGPRGAWRTGCVLGATPEGPIVTLDP